MRGVVGPADEEGSVRPLGQIHRKLTRGPVQWTTDGAVQPGNDPSTNEQDDVNIESDTRFEPT
jgi:hypothetical protein